MTSVGNLAFEALADPTRRAILSFLATQGESSAGDIAVEVATVGRTGISNHLRILRAAGLVRQRRDGRFRLYALDPSPAQELIEFLSGYTSAREVLGDGNVREATE